MNVRVLNLLLRPACGRCFTFLLLLNLSSNGMAAYTYHNIILLVFVLLLSFASAYIESAVCLMVSPRCLSRICFCIMVVVHELLLLIDAFLIYQFQTIVNQDVVDIIAATNIGEIRGFAATYLRPSVLIAFGALMVAINVLLVKIARWLSGKKHQPFSVICAFAGMMVWTLMILCFVIYNKGMDIPKCHAVTRVANSLNVLRQNLKKNAQLCQLYSDMRPITTGGSLPDVVVVIGESHSVYHSSLYGYKLPTSPMLAKRVAEGDLAVFDDVVSTADITSRAMKSVFSLDSLSENYGMEPLFPMCFRRAGYVTALYDNQYFEGKGTMFLCDEKLSHLLYNERNKVKYPYDMDMVNAMTKMKSPCLYIIHLNGQHYDYRERYPKSSEYFSADDGEYAKYGSMDKRLMVAQYDNATRYVDNVVDSIIRKFGDGDCCIVYLSDHGEEVYDYRNFAGHGNALPARERNYQLRVPLMVWLSPTYREQRPEMAARVWEAVHLPVSTDDFSHLILDLAGIDGGYLNPQRSVVNPLYDKSRHRIVLGGVDYDRRRNGGK